MVAALIILAVLLVAGGALYLIDRAYLARKGRSAGDIDSTASTGSDATVTDAAGSDSVSQMSAQTLDTDSASTAQTAGDAAARTDSQMIDSEVCCGMHLTCEKDSLSTAISTEVIYYDDEELDIYANRGADSYSPAEAEQFRDVLLTLLPSDIAGWARSLQLRHIDLPADVREELLMIVAEARAAT